MIEILNLSRHFGTVRAISDLTLHIPGGELFCFLGPNGAGKTTTIKILSGLLRPTAGAVRIAGIDLQADPVGAKSLMGYIPDMPFLYPRLTASEFMEFTGELYGLPRAAIAGERDRLFDLFSLQEQAGSLIGELSHGMKQRLIYAATLLHKPQVLLIDEPLVGLDPHTIRLIKDLLRRQAASGVTVFLTTHILALAQEIGHRIGIVANGRLTALGTFAELQRLVPAARDLEDVFLALTQSPRKAAPDVGPEGALR